MPPRVRTDSISSMGDLLLRGWTMLAESCPDCLVPLMRDPATRHQHCVNCRQIYTENGDIVNGAPSHQPALPTQNGHGYAHVLTDGPIIEAYEPQRHEVQESTREVPDVAEVLAERMQQGWALLNDTCPMCANILMRNRQRLLYCVVCDVPVMTQAEAAARPPPVQEPVTPTYSPSSTPSPPALAAVAPHLTTTRVPEEGTTAHTRTLPTPGTSSVSQDVERARGTAATAGPSQSQFVAMSSEGGEGMGEVLDAAAPAAVISEVLITATAGSTGQAAAVAYPLRTGGGLQAGSWQQRGVSVFEEAADALLTKISEVRGLLAATPATGGNAGQNRAYVELMRECMAAYRETHDHIVVLSAAK